MDVSELEKGIEATRRELEAARGCHASSVTVLEEFLASSQDQMNTLMADCKKAQVISLRLLLVLFVVVIIVRHKGKKR